MNWKSFVPAILWVGVIFVMSCLYNGRISTLQRIPHLDKLVHFGFYFVLQILLVRGLNRQDIARPPNDILPFLMACFCVFYGMFIEFLQAYFFTYRSGDPLDIVANISGCLFAWLCITKIPALR